MKKREVIGAAFRLIGLANWQFDLQPDEITDALFELDTMMADWGTQGVRCGYSLNLGKSDPDDDSGLPDTIVGSVAANLALRLAPTFGKDVPPQLANRADDGWNSALVQFGQIAQAMRLPTLPAGAGDKYWRGTNWPYPNRNPERIDNGNDSTLEF